MVLAAKIPLLGLRSDTSQDRIPYRYSLLGEAQRNAGADNLLIAYFELLVMR